MDLVVGRLTTNPGGFGFVVPDQPDPDANARISTSRRPISLRRCTAIASWCASSGTRSAAPKGESSESWSAARRRSSAATKSTTRGLDMSCRSIERVLTDVQVPTGQSSSAEPGEMVLVEITRWPTATRGPVGRVVEVLGRIDEPGVDTQIIIRKFGIPDSALGRSRRGGHAARHRRQGPRHQGAHGLSWRDDRHDRRRTCPRFRRCDHDRAAAERSLLAWRPHRRCVALREGGQRARRGGVRARHVRVLHGARRAHVPVRAGDRTLQPESARRPAGADRA